MIVLIDNYDSFTYNLYQELAHLGATVAVHRNDTLEVSDVLAMRPAGIVISPGPGEPSSAGISCALMREASDEVPVLGVCLGMQCLGAAFGGRIVRAPELMHGKVSAVYHEGSGVFDGLPAPFDAVRYHSLAVEPESIPPRLEITARTVDGTIMGLRHRDLPLEGVQFHPESVLTRQGPALLANFLRSCGEIE